ncbi:MAG: hypothetical protein IT537_09915 [Hyphomicrobiales bacterium]|nr:hypothetical protein [Hyphomicrobiales bacterium]
MRLTATTGTLFLALLASSGAQAQWGYGPPAPHPYATPYYAPPPVVMVPPYPYVVPGPYPGAVVVNERTGRWCTVRPDGYRWCWTP